MNLRCTPSEQLRRCLLASTVAAFSLGTLSAQPTTPTPVTASPAGTPATKSSKPLTKEEQAALDKAAKEQAKTAEATEQEKSTVVLSPFEVLAENSGYMATSSASGTRLRSNLSDLASPVSVVTKQQLQDMAAVDINDIFRSETNVEGLYQYTEIGFDRNQVVDTASNNPEANNRIRGTGQANITAGGMSVSSVIALDSYNIDSLEIARGANSNIFGIGSNAGTVNLNLASANMVRDFSKASLRADNLGGVRATLDLNRVLIRSKLALRLLAANGDKGFVREPSYDQDKRFTAALRAQPFRGTSLKVSYETVRQRQSLPNMQMPREGITSWKEAGAYTWDPATATVYNSANQPVHYYTGVRAPAAGTANAGFGGDALLATYRFQGGSGDSGNQRPVVGYIGGNIAYFTSTGSWVFASRNATTGNNTYNQTGDQRLVDYQIPGVQIYVPEINPDTGQPFGLLNTAFNEQLIAVHGANAKSFYDWERYNINASNRAEKAANTIRAELEQSILTGEKHQLAFQLGFLFEDIDNKSWNFIGNGGDGVQGIIYTDINRTLPDGTKNPGYLRPYIRARQPQRYDRPEANKTMKAQIAYLLDLTHNQDWSRWLGKHNFLVYGEDRERRNAPTALRYRSQLINGASGPIDRGVGNSDSLNTRYYLGDATGFNVDEPTTSPPTQGVVPYTYWSTEFGGTGAVRFDDPKFRTVNANIVENYFSGGTQKSEIRSEGGIWQGFLLNGRIVPTIGWRKDRTRFVSSKPYLATDPRNSYTVFGYPDVFLTDPNPTLFDFNDNYSVVNPRAGKDENSGQTRTQGVVVKPFLGWTRSKILNGMSLTYNRSASYEPAAFAIDTYGDVIGDPTGTSEDMSIRFSLFNDHLWISLNKYKSTVVNSRNGNANVVAQRAIPFDVDVGDTNPDTEFANVGSPNQQDLFDWYFYRIYGDATVPTGGTQPNPPGTTGGDLGYLSSKGLIGANDAETRARVTAHIFGLMKYDPEIIRKRNNAAGAVNSATNDITSKGYELEMLFRTKNWNMKLTGAKKEVIDSNIAASLTRYIAERMPILQAATYTNTATGITDRYWTGASDSSGNTHANLYYSNVISVFNPLVANLGKPRPQTRTYTLSATTSYALAGISDNKILKGIRVGGNLGWSSKGSIGFGYKVPVKDPIAGTYTVTELDGNKPIYDKARYSGSAWAAYDFKMFSGRAKSTVQFNVQNMLEDGRLQGVAARTDGQRWAYRIIDPRVYQLTWSIEL